MNRSILHLAALLAAPATLVAQAAVANTTQAGTVKSIAGSTVIITTDAKAELTVIPEDGARLLQLAPGSHDLKAAQSIALSDMAPGDRVLVTGHAGDAPGSVLAVRVILMKAAAVADLHASQSADWARRGTGGIVKAVSSPDITIAVGQRTITLVTTPQTIYRRYSEGSVKFEDARTGTLADIQPGNQLRVRGSRSDDGSTITAEEIVSGAFQNIAGVLLSVDAAGGSVSLRDLTTKRTISVRVTANSDLRALPADVAQLYARTHSGQAGASGASSSEAAARPAPAAGSPAGDQAEEQHSHRNFELSQMVGRLPQETLDMLKPGQAVLIVASQAGNGQLTAITLLSGVEPILTATPSGAAPTLSPWSLGSGAGDAGGGTQ